MEKWKCQYHGKNISKQICIHVNVDIPSSVCNPLETLNALMIL